MRRSLKSPGAAHVQSISIPQTAPQHPTRRPPAGRRVHEAEALRTSEADKTVLLICIYLPNAYVDSRATVSGHDLDKAAAAWAAVDCLPA